MKLHQFLFLNIIALVGYIDIFIILNCFLDDFLYKTFKFYISFSFKCDIFTYNNIIIPVYICLFFIEYLLVKSKKIQPIIKSDKKVFIIQFYITFTISLLSAFIYFFAVYQINR